MKKQQLLILAIILSFLALSKTNFCQTLNFGILSSFEAYTGAGGVVCFSKEGIKKPIFKFFLKGN